MFETYEAEIVSLLNKAEADTPNFYREERKLVTGSKRRIELWSEEEDNRLREEFASGKSVRELTKLHERSMGEITFRLKKLELIH